MDLNLIECYPFVTKDLRFPLKLRIGMVIQFATPLIRYILLENSNQCNKNIIERKMIL